MKASNTEERSRTIVYCSMLPIDYLIIQYSVLLEAVVDSCCLTPEMLTEHFSSPSPTSSASVTHFNWLGEAIIAAIKGHTLCA